VGGVHSILLIIVTDWGLLPRDNIQALQGIAMGEGRALELILTVPARRYGDLVDILDQFQAKVTDYGKRLRITTLPADGFLVSETHHGHCVRFNKC